MSRTWRKNIPAVKTVTKNANLKILLAIAILTAIPFSLGKYFEFNTPGAFDSGAYVYSAKHVLDGAKIGIDEQPSAKVGTLLINMLGVKLFGFSDTGPKIVQALLQIAALVMMFGAMRKLFGQLPAAVGVILASIYLSAPLIAKFGNVKEQHMIAFMIIGVSCFVLRQLDGRWYWAVLSGMFIAWPPLFKETGVSAIAAVGLFVLAQPVLKHKTLKQTGTDIALLLAGAVISLVPVCIWLAIIDAPVDYWPYSILIKILAAGGDTASAGSYVSGSRQFQGFSEQAPRVLRYYLLLILPIALAASSIIARIWAFILRKSRQAKSYDRFVLLFAIWWILDMAFVWISPRSYEQYYLPLNASAAMLGGYLIAIYQDKLTTSVFKTRWAVTGILIFICMVIMSWPIFAGTEKSPHSGTSYGKKRRGYVQKWREVSNRRKNNSKGGWEVAGEYIRKNSQPNDRIYVWGWFPGIYVQAQRLSPTKKAFTSEMHTMSPQALSELVSELLTAFEKEAPKFIVDSRKNHFPWNRPPLELWPITQNGFLTNEKQAIYVYETAYAKALHEKIEPDEAKRFNAMKPLRDFVMNNYKIVPLRFGQHVVFELNNPDLNKDSNQ